MSYLFELLSQRKQFSNAFYAFKKNMDDNSSQLLGCARLLQLKKSHFFSQKDSLLALESFKEYEKLSSNEQLVLLPLYAKIHDNVSSLLDSLQ